MMRIRALAAAAVLACSVAGAQVGGGTQTLRPTELRADKLPTASVLRQLAAGVPVRALSIEGGWAWIETQGLRGWVRAGTLNLPAARSEASLLPSARESADRTVQALGVRSLPPRVGRHALIITVGKYRDANTPPLPGTRIDAESATQMATAMQVPPENIHYLRDEEATGDAIRAAIKELDARVMDGDRVYIHFSGHGTRYLDPNAGGCVEALLAYDGGSAGTLTNHEMAALLAPLSRKTDKMFVMYDACHSGGVIATDPVMRSRGLSVPTDEGQLRAKFVPTSEECSRPVNVKTRNLVVEAVDQGALPNDIVNLSSSRDNEISFDDELKGGLATEFMRDCMLRDAVDLDGSGAISIDEVRACAQEKINKRLEHDARFKPSTLVLNGNAAFVPAWFGAAQLAAVTSAPRPQPGSQVAMAPVQPPPAPPTDAPSPAPSITPPAPPQPVSPPPPASGPAAAPKPVSGADALKQVFDQRDAKRGVRVQASRERLHIGKDALDFSVTSDHKGFVYVAMAGSDNESLYVLFPNELDGNNTIAPGRRMHLPGSRWRLRLAGPAGTDHLLVMVTDAPRDFSGLPAAKVGPYVKSLNNQEGRASLGSLLTRAKAASSAECTVRDRGQHPAECSDAFGAAMFQVEEVK